MVGHNLKCENAPTFLGALNLEKIPQAFFNLANQNLPSALWAKNKVVVEQKYRRVRLLIATHYLHILAHFLQSGVDDCRRIKVSPTLKRIGFLLG